MDVHMNPENGTESKQNSQPQDQWVQGVRKGDQSSSFPDMSKKIPSLKNPMTSIDPIT